LYISLGDDDISRIFNIASIVVYLINCSSNCSSSSSSSSRIEAISVTNFNFAQSRREYNILSTIFLFQGEKVMVVVVVAMMLMIY
jgi:hypothetical protein